MHRSDDAAADETDLLTTLASSSVIAVCAAAVLQRVRPPAQPLPRLTHWRSHAGSRAALGLCRSAGAKLMLCSRAKACALHGFTNVLHRGGVLSVCFRAWQR